MTITKILIILFFIVLIHKPTYSVLFKQDEAVGLRMPLWFSIICWIVLKSAPNVEFIISHKMYDAFNELANQNEIDNE